MLFLTYSHNKMKSHNATLSPFIFTAYFICKRVVFYAYAAAAANPAAFLLICFFFVFFILDFR